MTKDIDTLLLGTRKGLLILKQQSDGWTVTQEGYTGVPVSYACTDPRTNILWAAADHGHWGSKLYRSPDMGGSWEEVEAPKYPDDAKIKQDTPATLSYIWLIMPGAVEQPECLYIGTEPGGLFISDDGGDTFQLVEGLWNHPSRQEHWFGGGRDHPGLCSIIIDPRNHKRLIVGVSCGGVFETTDGGHQWDARNRGLYASFLPDPHAEFGHDPHLIVGSPADPDVLWQQNHCGVFRSVDGGQNWHDVSDRTGIAHFGFPIVVDERDPETAWVVPAISDEQRMAIGGGLCVSRTENGGENWTPLREGLPQKSCYDVAYRHALDISETSLAFGTTTGNLFMSNDRGESWQCLGHHFPPIYSVRFVETH